MSRELGDAALLSAALISLGYQYLLRGDHERATALNMEAARAVPGAGPQQPNGDRPRQPGMGSACSAVMAKTPQIC